MVFIAEIEIPAKTQGQKWGERGFYGQLVTGRPLARLSPAKARFSQARRPSTHSLGPREGAPW